MTEFNFPKDKTGLDQPGTGPLDTGDTWTSDTGINYVWNGYAWTVSGGSGDLYLSKVNDDTAEGSITFEGQTTHEAGATITGAFRVDGNSQLFSNERYTLRNKFNGTTLLTQDAFVTSSGFTTVATNTNDAICYTTIQTVPQNTTGKFVGYHAAIDTTDNVGSGEVYNFYAAGNAPNYFAGDVHAGNISELNTIIDGATPKGYFNAGVVGLRYAALGIPSTGKLYGSASTANAFMGAPNAYAATFVGASSSGASFDLCLNFGTRVNNVYNLNSKIDLQHDDSRFRITNYSNRGVEIATTSTAGAGIARAVTFFSRTGSTYHEAGYISAGGNTSPYIQIRNIDGTAPTLIAATDTRNVVSATPLPSAVNAVKALNPSVLTLSSGAVVTSFPLDTTKINAAFAVEGEETDVDEEGNPEYAGVDHSRLVPLLTKALQEALDEIDSLKARLDAGGL